MKSHLSLLLAIVVMVVSPALAQIDMPGGMPPGSAGATPSAVPGIAGASPAMVPGAAPGMAPGMAPGTATPAAQPAASDKKNAAKDAKKEEPPAKPKVTEFKGSLMFSDEQVFEIHQALSGTLLKNEAEAAALDIPKVRKIILSGIYYKTSNNWIIWLNGQKLTPQSKMPPEIVDMQVTDKAVKLKWFDIGLNGIINVTMKPHHVYDIVTGVMLRE